MEGADGVMFLSQFLTSKLWNNSHRPELVEAALDDTLKELETTYLDLCASSSSYLHSPSSS